MTLWNVTAPTVRTVGNEKVRGTQTWVVQARRSIEAVRQVIARAADEDALRHRRAAVIDFAALTAAPWRSADGLLGPTVTCPLSAWSDQDEPDQGADTSPSAPFQPGTGTTAA
ncbi:hypothetical protein E3E14_07335 [Streptomyces sp. ICN441]|uniref:hypothetical protein n=1 Tax=Streptomyces sp. ICN441 TaxID=2558286 RepID=UPI00106CC61F|nr:hypothetical protein [Streptomyces sp. ICN441]TFE54547.1 hypothetical protein E3E14_07335 [Streptomyces sp. ICN441]